MDSHFSGFEGVGKVFPLRRGRPPCGPPFVRGDGDVGVWLGYCGWLVHYRSAMFFYLMLVRILTSRPYKIEGDSMLPALINGQYVLLTRASSSSRPLQRGDIVVHRHPIGLEGIYVKRIIGLPSEHVRLDSGRIYINDAPLGENHPDYDPASDDPTINEWWSGSDEYVVMGDNRRESRDDSRAFGAVPGERILGRVWFRYWPPNACGIL